MHTGNLKVLVTTVLEVKLYPRKKKSWIPENFLNVEFLWLEAE